MYEEYFISLEQRGYEVFDFKQCRNCTVFILQKKNDSSRKKYVLKLFLSHNVPDEATYTAWRNSFRLRCEKLGEYSYENIRIPHALEFWGNEYVPGFGQTFGILTDYVHGRTLSEMLYGLLQNDTDRRRLLLRVIPDYIDALLYGNKAGYYHLDIDESNLLVDIHDRGWLIDYIGAFICDDCNSGRIPDGGYHLCFSDRIAPLPSRADEFAERAKANGLECERLQTVILIKIIKNMFDRDRIIPLGKLCVADPYSPLEALRSNLSTLA